jgi:hypothetical protein
MRAGQPSTLKKNWRSPQKQPKNLLILRGHYSCVTRIWEQRIKVIADEVEEGFEVRIAGVFGLTVCSHHSDRQKGENFLR